MNRLLSARILTPWTENCRRSRTVRRMRNWRPAATPWPWWPEQLSGTLRPRYKWTCPRTANRLSVWVSRFWFRTRRTIRTATAAPCSSTLNLRKRSQRVLIIIYFLDLFRLLNTITRLVRRVFHRFQLSTQTRRANPLATLIPTKNIKWFFFLKIFYIAKIHMCSPLLYFSWFPV